MYVGLIQDKQTTVAHVHCNEMDMGMSLSAMVWFINTFLKVLWSVAQMIMLFQALAV